MMKKYYIIILCLLTFAAVKAQTPVIPTTQAFGKIDKADLEMTSCDFEKDANAEVLFDKGDVYFDTGIGLEFERHKRIKIFNESGKNEANIRIEYFNISHAEDVIGLEAETINLENGVIVPVKVDKKQIFTETVDKYRAAIVFSFPNVKPGSIIEFKYKLLTTNFINFPDWYFQGTLPTRYSQISTRWPTYLTYKTLVNIRQPFVLDKTKGDDTHIQALANIPSLKDEPFMDARNDNCQRVLYQLLAVTGTFIVNFQDTWVKVGENAMNWDNFGGQLNRKLAGEDVIINKAKSFKTDDEKIAYIFNEVKNTVKWNDYFDKVTNDGTVTAWNKKIGNSTEVNLILYHLLKKAGLTVYPMMVSTRKHGHINPAYPNSYQFNSTVAYIPVDSAKSYVLDATSKYNLYNLIPDNLLNSFGFLLNKDDNRYEMTSLQATEPARRVILINGDIAPDGKMTGAADISNYSYNRVNIITRYKTDGEKKYTDYLTGNNNNLKISGFKFDDMDVDTLPLRQTFNFNLDLNGADDNYIYFNANLFTNLKDNPFLNEERNTDIDFGYRDNYAVTGVFKLPAGYKIDALPKSITMNMTDNSIVFKRMVAEQDGNVIVRLNIDHKKSMYFKEDYAEFHEFCKKMYEMLNEQIVLKKS